MRAFCDSYIWESRDRADIKTCLLVNRLFFVFDGQTGKDILIIYVTITTSRAILKSTAALFLVIRTSRFSAHRLSAMRDVHITLTTSSGVWMMLSTICSMLPQVIVSLFGGVLADRYSRKHLIMFSDGFIALATLGLAIAFMAGYNNLWLILAVCVIRSIGAGIQWPAVSSIYPQIVPESELTRIHGLSQTIGSVLMLISPAVGGLLLGTAGIVLRFYGCDNRCPAIAVMAFISVKPAPVATEEISFFDDLKAGIKYTTRHPMLRRMIGCCIISFFLITPAAVLTPLMIERSYGPDVWRLTANEIVWTVGSLLGGAFVAIKGNFKNKFRVVALCMLAFGVLFALLGVARYFAIYLLLMGLAGCFLPVLIRANRV